MPAKVYQQLCEAMAKRGGEYPGMDIPEFYALVKELFTPEEAAVYLAIPRGYHPANAVAAEMGALDLATKNRTHYENQLAKFKAAAKK